MPSGHPGRHRNSGRSVAAAFFGASGLRAACLITTTSAGPWNCSQCTNYSSDSTNIDGKIGIGFGLGGAGELIVGYRAEYWSDVNVAITDNTNFGGNRGTSDHLVHGPFVSLKLGM